MMPLCSMDRALSLLPLPRLKPSEPPETPPPLLPPMPALRLLLLFLLLAVFCGTSFLNSRNYLEGHFDKTSESLYPKNSSNNLRFLKTASVVASKLNLCEFS